jgi:hypothetical protein
MMLFYLNNCPHCATKSDQNDTKKDPSPRPPRRHQGRPIPCHRVFLVQGSPAAAVAGFLRGGGGTPRCQRWLGAGLFLAVEGRPVGASAAGFGDAESAGSGRVGDGGCSPASAAWWRGRSSSSGRGCGEASVMGVSAQICSGWGSPAFGGQGGGSGQWRPSRGRAGLARRSSWWWEKFWWWLQGPERCWVAGRRPRVCSGRLGGRCGCEGGMAAGPGSSRCCGRWLGLGSLC